MRSAFSLDIDIERLQAKLREQEQVRERLQKESGRYGAEAKPFDVRDDVFFRKLGHGFYLRSPYLQSTPSRSKYFVRKEEERLSRPAGRPSVFSSITSGKGFHFFATAVSLSLGNTTLYCLISFHNNNGHIR